MIDTFPCDLIDFIDQIDTSHPATALLLVFAGMVVFSALF